MPAAVFCGNCGAYLDRPAHAGRLILRPRVFAAAPREPITAPWVTSSLFPHLTETARKPFRAGLILILAALVCFSILRLLDPLVIVTGLGVVVLFLLYVWQSDSLQDITGRALVISALVGTGLSVAWWLWTTDLIAKAYGVPLGAGAQLMQTLGVGLAITLAGAGMMLLPALVVRLLRQGTRESLDGFVIGALGALCYSAAGTITWLAPQYIAGLLTNFRPWRAVEESFLYGIVDPLTAAAAGGLFGLVLWFHPRPESGGHRLRVRVVLASCAAVAVGIYMAVYVVDATDLPRAPEMIVNAALTALSMLTVRVAVQLALLHEAPDPAGDAVVVCPDCGKSVRDMPFCQQCGAAARAASRSSRRAAGRLIT